MITRKAQKNQNRLEYGFRVVLDVDQSTQSITSPLNAYSTEENSVVGTWVLLERSTVPSGVCRSKRALTSNVRQKGSYRYKSTARVPYRHRYYVQYRYVLVAVRGHFGYIPGFNWIQIFRRVTDKAAVSISSHAVVASSSNST